MVGKATFDGFKNTHRVLFECLFNALQVTTKTSLATKLVVRGHESLLSQLLLDLGGVPLTASGVHDKRDLRKACSELLLDAIEEFKKDSLGG